MFYRNVKEPETVQMKTSAYTIPRNGHGDVFLSAEDVETPFCEVLFNVGLANQTAKAVIVPKDIAADVRFFSDSGKLVCFVGEERQSIFEHDGIGESIYSFMYSPENLRRWLKMAGMSRKALAGMFSVSDATVNAWCAPESNKSHRDMPAAKWRDFMFAVSQR